MREDISVIETVSTGLTSNSKLGDHIVLQRASALIEHRDSKGNLLSEETVYNVITNSSRVQYHTQCFGTSGLLTNGLNYIGLSNDTLTETSASTTLTNEIVANGLTRAQGTVTLASGAGNQTTISKVFTATGTQAAQKAALFSASSAGIMGHVLAFTQRTLQTDDTLTVTFTITLG